MKSMYPKSGRVILHVDMNSFYASVEVAHDSSLKGKPLAIAGNVEERRGIIVTCSYEARAKGVKTTMPLWEAKKLCPNLLVRKPNLTLYREASLKMFDILSSYTDFVEPVSIDEGYLDISNCSHLGSPPEIAQQIQNDILQRLHLPCSIGIAPNKFLAKTASDMKKPMGITILRKRDIRSRLWPLKVEEMHGIGKKTAEKLNRISIFTIQDLAMADEYQLKQLLGINGTRLKQKANGIDERPVDPDAVSDFKTIGNSTTLREDTTNTVKLKQAILELSKSVSERMKTKNVVSSNIQLTLRFSNRKTVTRSRKLVQPVSTVSEVLEAALFLFHKHWDLEPLRLLGVTALELQHKNETAMQLDIFSYEDEAKNEPLYTALDQLRERYGESIIQKGVQSKQKKNANQKGTSFDKDFLWEASRKNKRIKRKE